LRNALLYVRRPMSLNNVGPQRQSISLRRSSSCRVYTRRRRRRLVSTYGEGPAWSRSQIRDQLAPARAPNVLYVVLRMTYRPGVVVVVVVDVAVLSTHTSHAGENVNYKYAHYERRRIPNSSIRASFWPTQTD